jgi:hypothetical protein
MQIAARLRRARTAVATITDSAVHRKAGLGMLQPGGLIQHLYQAPKGLPQGFWALRLIRSFSLLLFFIFKVLKDFKQY